MNTSTETISKKLLIVDDDAGLRKQLKWSFAEFEVVTAKDREEATTLLKGDVFPVILLDLGLPPDESNASEGLALLNEIVTVSASSKVIVVTGNDSRENALEAINIGAYDFYEKPIDIDVLKLIVNRAYRLYDLEKENRELMENSLQTTLNGFITANPEMREICRKIEKVAPTDITVLLLGESGTGKELLARSLYDLSGRTEGKFVAINCAAIPENLLESELFGYEKGAFTGAAKRTIGKVELAQKGVLFLDEVGDLPIGLQAKLLRFLQERVFERVGGRKEIEVDLRIVCATHQNLKEKISTGEFREDLFYRISEVSISIPALRERPGDSILLAQYFMKQYQVKDEKPKKMSQSAVFAIENHDWPGNARELENRIKRAMILSEDNAITADDMDLADSGQEESLSLKDIRSKSEHDAILKALALADGKISSAAKILGISRPTLYVMMEKFGLK